MRDPSQTATTARPAIPALGNVYAALEPLVWPMLRIVTGLLLVPHGAQKLFGWFGGHGLSATGEFFSSQLGYPAGFTIALIVGLTEFVGGILLAVGALTRPVALAVFVLMAVVVLDVHLPNGFFWTAGGYEYPLMWGVLALAFVIKGAGRHSVDALVGTEI